MAQVALAGNDDGNTRDCGSGNAQDIRVKIVGMNDLKTASPQEPCQPKHLIDAVNRIEATFWIELAHGDRRSPQFLKQRSPRTEASQRDVVTFGIKPGRELNRLHFGSADIQRIEQEENSLPRRSLGMAKVAPALAC